MDLGVGCYYLEVNTMTYGEALDTCEALDSHLVYITSADEQSGIQTYLEGFEWDDGGTNANVNLLFVIREMYTRELSCIYINGHVIPINPSFYVLT